MPKYKLLITNQHGLATHYWFSDKPEERWQGDVLRVEGLAELEDGKPMAVYVSVRSNQSVVIAEQLDNEEEE